MTPRRHEEERTAPLAKGARCVERQELAAKKVAIIANLSFISATQTDCRSPSYLYSRLIAKAEQDSNYRPLKAFAEPVASHRSATIRVDEFHQLVLKTQP